MRARILFVSDLHKRDCDFSTIAGYTKAIDAVQRDILSFIKQRGITHLVRPQKILCNRRSSTV